MNCGTITYVCPYAGKRIQSRPTWVVDCPPHVRTRLKRTFAGVEQHAADTIALTDTPANARDLAWFLDRFPMEVQAADHLASRAAEHRHRERFVAEMFVEAYSPPPVELAVPLRDYQRLAVDMAMRSKGLLIGDDVGTGKTATAIGMFADARTLPAMVVTLTHLPRQWEAEIRRFAPSLRVKIAKTANPDDLTRGVRRKPADPWDVLIVNYHKLDGLAEAVAPKLNSVVFDECQELRRGDSFKYRAARHIAERVEFRCGLSATPIFNYGGEIWSVLDCLAPDFLGTRDEFIREWCNGGFSPRLINPKAFGSYARESGLMLRRTRADVGRELLALSKFTQEIGSDLREIDKVADEAAELARVILSQGGRRRGEQLEASQQLSWKLRQATGIAKANAVADFVRMLVENGEKVLLYGFHHAVYDLWRGRLLDLKPAFYTGQESQAAKAESIRRFTGGSTDVLIMATRAGAGIDGLQHACRTVVYGELDWSPAVHEQGIGRVYRDGQKEPVVAYFLVADSGSDPVVADVLGLKRQQIEGLINPDAADFERLEVDPDHIKRLAEDFLRRRGLPVVAEDVPCSP